MSEFTRLLNKYRVAKWLPMAKLHASSTLPAALALLDLHFMQILNQALFLVTELCLRMDQQLRVLLLEAQKNRDVFLNQKVLSLPLKVKCRWIYALGRFRHSNKPSERLHYASSLLLDCSSTFSEFFSESDDDSDASLVDELSFSCICSASPASSSSSSASLFWETSCISS